MTQGFVVDCSAIMGLCFEDETTEFHDVLLQQIEMQKVYAPEIFLSELGNVLLVAERRKRIKTEEALEFIGLVESLGIELLAIEGFGRVRDVMETARKYHLSFYDAQYLHGALMLKVPLLTMDKQLRLAGKKAGLPAF